ncbi:hypothetical protein F5Y17DRAFT_328562 [Xylariaceae sp. FL0594]|nr:hypothetical protein F5Y17DRAFT_328562 [Xylariaceae sp. FL0594]
MKVKLSPTLWATALWATTSLCATSLWALTLGPQFCALNSAPSICLQLFSATEGSASDGWVLMWAGGSLKSTQFCMGCFSILACTGCNFDCNAEKKGSEVQNSALSQENAKKEAKKGVVGASVV